MFVCSLNIIDIPRGDATASIHGRPVGRFPETIFIERKLDDERDIRVSESPWARWMIPSRVILN